MFECWCLIAVVVLGWLVCFDSRCVWLFVQVNLFLLRFLLLYVWHVCCFRGLLLVFLNDLWFITLMVVRLWVMLFVVFLC